MRDIRVAAGLVAALIVALQAAPALAQEAGDIDPSVPTNLYTNIDFNFELQDHPGDGEEQERQCDRQHRGDRHEAVGHQPLPQRADPHRN